jgi:patatin-like phospholipase/acyl hydrolase
MKTSNSLSLSGGGCRGYIALHQLEYLHSRMGGRFLRHFDYIGGTSTGSLITALLAVGKTPTEIITIYEEELPKIFKKGFFRHARGLSKYSNEYFIGLAKELVGDVKLGELKQAILIPALNSSLDKPKIFKSYDPKDEDYKLVDVIIASSSAPTYFPAHKIEGNFYKDGGLFANNPSDILLKECRANDYKKINILSITTGATPKRLSKSEQKGNILSVVEMINETLYQQDLAIHGGVSFEYEKIKSVKGTYIRCESFIEHSSGEIDDVSKTNIADMKLDGQFSVLQNKNKLDLFHLNTLKNE